MQGQEDKPPAKKKPKTKWQKQIARLDKYFNEFIRLDAMDPKTMKCRCVTCGRWRPWNMRKTHAGHFINKSDTKNLRVRWMELNVNCQCYTCNKEYSGNKYEYSKYLNAAYGPGTDVYLEMYATKPFNPIIFDIESKIIDYRERVKALKKLKGVVDKKPKRKAAA